MPFTVRGEPSGYYPDLDGFAADARVELKGTVRNPFWTASEKISLAAIVDICSEGESPPPCCRVDERDEKNNDSPQLSVTLNAAPIIEGSRLVTKWPTINDVD